MVSGGKGGLSDHYLDKPGLCPGASRLGVIQALFTQTSIIYSPTIPYVAYTTLPKKYRRHFTDLLNKQPIHMKVKKTKTFTK